MELGAIILTGGGGVRMGGADKAAMAWGGVRAVDRLAELAFAVGAQSAVTAGPIDYGLPAIVEDPPGGGPAAGVLAVVKAIRCRRVLVLAVDAPTVTADDLAPLLSAPAPGAAYEGLHLPLVAEVAALPAGPAHGWAMGRLIEAAGLARLPCPPDAALRLRGANTPEEREVLLRHLVAADPAQKDGKL